jgi:hypothetical protein
MHVSCDGNLFRQRGLATVTCLKSRIPRDHLGRELFYSNPEKDPLTIQPPDE